MSPRRRGPTPNGWAAITAAGVVCAAAAWGWTCVWAPALGTPVVRAPVAVVRNVPPPAAEPWYRWALPVDRSIVPVTAHLTGYVRVDRIAVHVVRVTITGLRSDLAHADMRVQLAAGDVIGSTDHARWVPGGAAVEVGVLRHGQTAAVFTLTSPQLLPPAVHSLLLLDVDTRTVFGAALLLPAQ